MTYTFCVEQKRLHSLLTLMQPICTKRTPLDITTHIMFSIEHNELILKGTDLEISLQLHCPLEQSTLGQEPLVFLVSGKRIFDIVKELDETISCTFADNQLTLSSGTVKVALNIKDAQEFPPFPERIENLMGFKSEFLLKLLDKVAFLIPQNNANPALNGLLLEINNAELKMTTTDGHCLAQTRTSEYHLDTNCTWLLPRRAIFELKRLLDGAQDSSAFLGMCGNQLVFSGERFNFFTKLLADSFPSYETILDKKDFLPATIDRSRFIKTLRRSACLLSGQFLATEFGFGQNSLKVSMENKDVGKMKEEVPLQDFTGAQLDVRFYAPYLLGGLQVFEDEKVSFYLKNTATPIIFESMSDQCAVTYLVMPVSPTAMR